MVTFSKLGKMGGLGNQLFQIASTIGIAKKNDMPYGFYFWGEYQKYFCNRLPTVKNVDRITTLIHNGNFYKEFKLNPKSNYDLQGYFQSWKYFNDYRELLLRYFCIDIPSWVNLENKEYVSIHIRRGDYINLSHIHTNLSETDYYQKAINYFDSNQKFLIYSDDIKWCKENFKGQNFTYVEGSETDIQELHGMSTCSSNIIANSSFSWWAAYLNLNPDKIVIAPKKYLMIDDVIEDRILKEWILL